VAYVVLQLVRRRAVARFTDEAMLASVVPARLGWRRHVAMVVLVATLVVLTVGFARPQSSTRVPRKAAVVMLVLDTSQSMSSTDVAPTRLAAAQQQATQFVRQLPALFRVGVVNFGTSPTLLVSPTTDHQAVQNAIRTLTPAHATATAAAIDLSLRAADAARKDGSTVLPATLVLLSDGSPSVAFDGLPPAAAAEAQASRAKQMKTPIDTISFGATATPRNGVAPADPTELARIAQLSGGRAFTAQSAQQLGAVYRTIGTTIGHQTRTHDLTAWFTGAALALMLVGAAAGILLTQRLL
jgi:Ca-activated chloride channel family protein